MSVRKKETTKNRGGCDIRSSESVATFARLKGAVTKTPMFLNPPKGVQSIRVTLATGKTMRGFVQRVTAESLALSAVPTDGGPHDAWHPSGRTFPRGLFER